MSGKTRDRLWGDRVRAARIHADNARKCADDAIREADAAACRLWSEQMEGFGGPSQPSPTIAQALNGGFGFLEVQCKRCETRTSIPLEHIRRKPDTPIWKLGVAVMPTMRAVRAPATTDDLDQAIEDEGSGVLSVAPSV